MVAKADAKVGLVSFVPFGHLQEEQRPVLFSPYIEIFHNSVNWAYALVGF